MPDVTPAGPLSIAVDGLRTLIGNVPYFQTWTGSGSAAAALNRVYTADIGVKIQSVTIAGGTLTIATRYPHTFQIGDTALIIGAELGAQSAANIDGAITITATSATTITATTAAPDVATFYPKMCYVVSGPRPLALICESDHGLSSKSIGTGGASIFQGAVEILLEADVSTAYQNDARNAYYEARNAVGQMVQGLSETQDTGDFMVINEVELINGPELTSAAAQDSGTIRFERWRAILRVTWGVNG